MESESKRPPDTAFRQQRLKAWQPVLTPKWVIGTFLVVGIVFIPIGAAILVSSSQVKQEVKDYATTCGKPDWTTSKYCNITFTLTEKWSKPVYVYYQLSNFFQNHRRYVQSRSDQQLRGDFGSSSGLASASDAKTATTDCTPMQKPEDNDNLYLYPCGLVAFSVFNDTFNVKDSSGNFLNIDRKDIAWPSDKEKKFQSKSLDWMKKNCKRYGPSEKNFQLAGFSFSWSQAQQWAANEGSDGVFDCWHYVEDEPFIVWMRTAGLPKFKKLYGKIDQDIPAGTYTVNIDNNFPVLDFSGDKAFVLSTTTWIGGKNNFLAIAYLVVGCVCMVLAVGFAIKQKLSPRQLGDERYLNWKQ